MDSRNNYLDFIKGIAIVLVIIGHVLQHIVKTDLFSDPLFTFIYSFHMPLFIGISGYLFYYSAKKTLKEIVVKRFRQLIVPLFFWTFIIYLIMLLKKPEDSLINTIVLYGRLLPSWYWFLVVLFISSIVLSFTENYLKQWYYQVAVLLIILLIPDFSSMRFLKYMYPIFLLGFLYHRYSLTINKQLILIIGVSIIFFITGLFFWERDFYIYTTGSQILFKDGIHIKNVLCNLFRYGIGISGSIVILFIAKLLFDRFKFESMEKLGKETLGIYLIHLPLLEALSFKGIMIFNGFLYIQVIVMTLLLLIISYLIIRLLNQWTFSRNFLLGKP